MGLSCCVCLWLLLALALLGASAWQCPRIPYSSTRNFSVPYTLPSLDAGSPIQNVAVFTDSDGPVAVFVAIRNRILLVSPELRLLSVLVTGPMGSARCEICRLCPAITDGPEDTDNVLLLLDPLEPWLYSCGTAQHGLCYQHQLEVRDGKVAITATHCLYSAMGNSPAFCPDCVVSPLGTSATVVATSYASIFYLGSTIDSSVAARYSPQSVSIRRLKGTLDGFSNDFQWLTVLPQYRDNYTIHYVHSFADGDHVYFLMVQPERPGSAAYHTRLARLSTHERHLRRYRELVLDCRFESKRRRRRSGEEDAERDIAYNVLQAAHAARPGARLARDLGINDTDTVLFGAFAESHPESPVPQENSAVCAFPLRLLNQAMEEGMKKCCGTGHHYSPHVWPQVNLSAPVVDTSCWDQPTLVPAASHKVDLFNGQLTGVLLTSLFVTAMGDVTVAHLGTAEGRIFQVGWEVRWDGRSRQTVGYAQPPPLAVLHCWHQAPCVWLLNVTGPGCRHFSTCQRCLRAERFMGCGWCGDGCRRRHECPGRWVQDSCPPFHPRSAPLQGRTRVTLCGMTFRSRLETDPCRGPRGACRVAVGQRGCTVLPEESDMPLAGSGGFGSFTCPTDPISAQEPHVSALHPPFGPRGGGTHLSLHGKHLSAGSSWRVMVNGSECALSRQPRYAPALPLALRWSGYRSHGEHRGVGPSPPGPAHPTWAIPRAHPEPSSAPPCPQECKDPLAPDRLLCHSPAFPFESNVEVVPGNLSVLLDGADGRWLFRLRYYSRPKVYPLQQEGRRLRLKPGEDEIEVHVRGAAG
uniref:Sema domain-containing protein n=1 Tax=Junco hyemalis TaxID=40217 RepID=A0A8C5IUM8_JUNHY